MCMCKMCMCKMCMCMCKMCMCKKFEVNSTNYSLHNIKAYVKKIVDIQMDTINTLAGVAYVI